MSAYSGAEGSLPNFGEMVKNSDIYQLDETVYDEGCDISTEVPFVLLSGETPLNIGLCCKEHLLVLTNYRLFASVVGGYYSRPLGLIEFVTYNQPLDIVLTCRDSCTIKLILDSVAQCRLWLNRIQSAIKPAINFRDTFAFIHFAYSTDTQPRSSYLTSEYDKSTRVTAEYKRLGMDRTGQWRITEINTQYKLCSTYPKLIIVPRSISDVELGEVAKYRSGARVPAIVWRHRGNGSVIARSSQPLVGVLGWRCQEDEKFVAAITISCHTSSSIIKAPAMESMHHEETNKEPEPPSLLVMDLRSYTAVLGNRAKGGGCECVDYYPNCEVVWKGLPNIHTVRNSFQLLRTLLSNRNKPGFLSGLEHSQWLLYVNQLLSVAVEAVAAIEDGRPVLVHCSDGWDRTTQVVALAQLMLDPHYRTIEGFQQLVEKEWISFGHRFADRSGCTQADTSQQSPVFLQWLDSVHQLVKQFPTVFQFNIALLAKLALHCYSMLYGTFLFNCERERDDERIERQTVSVWHFIHHNKKEFVNVLYEHDNQVVLYPKCELHSTYLWRELFMSSSLIPYASTQHVSFADIPSRKQNNYHFLSVNRTDGKFLSPHQNGSARHGDPHSPSSGTPNGILNQTLDSGEIPEGFPSSIEDSFRVVVEDELSLTKFTVPQLIDDDSSHSLNRKHSLVSSFSSECDSRLRLLGHDGLAKCNDPIQNRVFEMKAALQLQVDHLQENLDRLNLVLRTKRESEEASSPSVIASPECTKEDEELQFSCSPASGWMCVNASDSRGVQWVPDHSVLHCQMCGENFWLGRRRHHCRSCGNVFCWKCSNYFCPVPQEQLFGQQRVCRKCFDKLDGFLEPPETSS